MGGAHLQEISIVPPVGAAIVHFLWQGCVVGGVLVLLLHLARTETAFVRARMLQWAMIVFLLVPTATALRATLPQGSVAGRGEGSAIAHSERIDPASILSGSATPGARTAASFSARDGDGAPKPRLNSWRRAAIGSIAGHASICLGWIAITWLLGALACVAQACGAAVLLARLRRRARPAGPPWNELLLRARSRTSARASPQVLQSEQVTVPMIAGAFRPVLLVPGFQGEDSSPADSELVLAHELVHVERHDPRWNLLQTVVERLLFFHPVVWWASRRLRVEREHACDDRVAELYGDPTGYARALAGLEERAYVGPRLVLAVTEGPLLTRIRRLTTRGVDLASPRPGVRRAGWIAGVSGVALLAVGTWLAPVPAAPPPGPLSYDAWLAKVNDALDGGDETRAMRILCSAHEDLPWRHSFGSSATTYVRLAELIHKRHAEVFLPPGNIEDLVPYIWWSRLGPWQDGQDRPARVKRAQEIGAPDAVDSTHVYRRAPPAPFLIRVDLDLDGTAELTFDGQSVDTHGGAVAVDRADDGRREQWLVAPAGVDPRQRSAIFFYRDGDYYILLVDVDGDGEGEYQSAGCVPRNED